MEANEVVALVYRVGNPGCRQYAFGSVRALQEWVARPAYRNDALRVLVLKDCQIVAEHVCPAAEAVARVREALQ